VITLIDTNLPPYAPPDGGLDSNHLWYVAHNGDEAVGVLVLNDPAVVRREAGKYIDMTYVLPAHRRCGVAHSLILRARFDGHDFSLGPIASKAGLALARASKTPRLGTRSNYEVEIAETQGAAVLRRAQSLYLQGRAIL